MKLPRWLVIGLLGSSVLAALGAAGWWWLTWPAGTARAFVDYIADGRIEQARSMSAAPNVDALDLLAALEDRRSALRRSRLESSQRTLAELVYGRQRFAVPTIDYSFTVERGAVMQQALGGDDTHFHLLAVHKLFTNPGAPSGSQILANSKSTACASCHSTVGSRAASPPHSNDKSTP